MMSAVATRKKPARKKTSVRKSSDQAVKKRSAYDGASYAAPLRKIWKNASEQNFDTLLESEREILVKRIRHELRNGAYAKSIARKYANYVVGAGPQPQIRCPKNPEWASQVKNVFKTWARRCNYKGFGGLGGMLRLGIKQFFTYGEFIWVAKTSPKAIGPIKLKLLSITPTRLKTPPGEEGNPNFHNGVECDDEGVPVRYWFLKREPDDVMFAGDEDFMSVPVEQLVHVFRQDDPTQYRGEPWHVTALTLLAKIRRFNDATVNQAELAAMIAGFLEITNPELLDPRDVKIEGFKDDIEAGTIMTSPPGYHLETMKSEHPNNNYVDFRRENIGETGTGACDMPVNVTTGDSSRHNFSSVNKDDQIFFMGVQTQQCDIVEMALSRIFDWVHTEGSLAGVFYDPRADWTQSWLWMGRPLHIDPQKVANGRHTALGDGQTSLVRIWTEDGLDPEEQWDLLQEQEQEAKRRDLNLNFMAENKQLNPNTNAQGDNSDASDQ